MQTRDWGLNCAHIYIIMKLLLLQTLCTRYEIVILLLITNHFKQLHLFYKYLLSVYYGPAILLDASGTPWCGRDGWMPPNIHSFFQCSGVPRKWLPSQELYFPNPLTPAELVISLGYFLIHRYSKYSFQHATACDVSLSFKRRFIYKKIRNMSYRNNSLYY